MPLQKMVPLATSRPADFDSRAIVTAASRGVVCRISYGKTIWTALRILHWL